MSVLKDIKVTLISKSWWGRGFTAILHSIGPKNIRYTPIYEGKMRYVCTDEKRDWLIVEGFNLRLVSKLKKAYDAYQKAQLDLEDKRKHDLWDFQDQWRKDNPSPTMKRAENRIRAMKGINLLKI